MQFHLQIIKMICFHVQKKRSHQIRLVGKLLIFGCFGLTIYGISRTGFENPTIKKDDNTTAFVLNIANEIIRLESFYTEKTNEKGQPTVGVLQEGNSKENHLTAFTMQKELVYNVYCPSSRVEEAEWKGHFINDDNANQIKNLIPTKIDESPLGSAPIIPTDFLIEETDFCAKRPEMKSVAIVPTAILNIDRRHVTRRTWGRVSEELGILFFVGISKNEQENEIILKESHIYHDIIQGNYTDLYQLLVYKNLNAFYWLTKYCTNVKWVIHADDDCLFNVRKYVQFINNFNYSNPNKHLFCSIQCDSNPERNNSKSIIAVDMYPYNTYPIYCSGFIWFTSMNNIKSLLKVVPQVKFLWIDDVFVTGLLAERANISRYMIPLGDSVEPNEIGNNFGWMTDGINRSENWKKVTAFYSPNL